MIEIKQIDTTDTYPLRRDVLCLPDRADDCHFDHDDNSRGFHLGAFDGQTLVGVVSLLPRETPKATGQQPWQLRGMAVAANFQGKQVGAALVTCAVELLQQRGADLIWCSARIHAVGFYEKMGFLPCGDYYEVPLYGNHIVMAKSFTE